MSWSLSIVGSRAAVKQAVHNDRDLPETIKAAIIEVCDDPAPYSEHDGVIVKGYGHLNDGNSCQSNIGMLSVEPMHILSEPTG